MSMVFDFEVWRGEKPVPGDRSKVIAFSVHEPICVFSESRMDSRPLVTFFSSSWMTVLRDGHGYDPHPKMCLYHSHKSHDRSKTGCHCPESMWRVLTSTNSGATCRFRQNIDSRGSKMNSRSCRELSPCASMRSFLLGSFFGI